MEPIWDWGNSIIVSLQTVQNPALNAMFNGITFLGEETFLLLLFPFIFWVIDKSVGTRLAYLVLISIALNAWAKLTFNHPRPFEWPTEAASPVLRLNYGASSSTPGIPSGHAQNAIALWFYLAHMLKPVGLWPLAAILFILISFSRIYLGVHFPTDVLGGALLGLLLLLLFIRFEPWVTSRLSDQSLPVQIGLASIVPLIIVLIEPVPDVIAALMTLSGFSLGLMVERAKIGFQISDPSWQRLLRYIVGLLMLVIIFEGLDLIIPAPENILHLPLTLVRYAVSGFWVSAGAPWLFTRLNLA